MAPMLLWWTTLSGCDAAFARPKVEPPAPPPNALILRSTFDTDPSAYVGRFVPDGTPAATLDESAGKQTRCSSFVTWKEVSGGGVTYDELWSASTGASLSAQIPSAATVSVGATAARTVRVKYTVDKKMISSIGDIDGYAACCARAPDQCSAAYIGEFVSGTGALYYAQERSAGGKAVIDPPGIDVISFPSVEVRHGVSWSRGVVFTQPVYFGFKLHPNPAAPVEWACDATTVPQSALGYYFVGVSPVVKDEATARNDAMSDARRQALGFMGMDVSMAEQTVDGTTTRSADARAEGFVAQVRAQKSCVEQVPMPTGTYVRVRTLAFVPNAAVEAPAPAGSAAPPIGTAPPAPSPTGTAPAPTEAPPR